MLLANRLWLVGIAAGIAAGAVPDNLVEVVTIAQKQLAHYVTLGL